MITLRRILLFHVKEKQNINTTKIFKIATDVFSSYISTRINYLYKYSMSTT